MDYEEKMTEEEMEEYEGYAQMSAEERYYEYVMSGQAERDIADFWQFVREHTAEEIEMMLEVDPVMREWYDRHASGASARALRRFLAEYREEMEEYESAPGKRAAGGFVEPPLKYQCLSA
jgi:hypothetical protein